jgi:hypothetical protein
MMKRVCILILLLAVICFSQLGCNSSNQANAPANTNASVQVSDTKPSVTTNNAPNAPAQTTTGNRSNSSFPELAMIYSQLFTARMKNDRAKVESLLADDYKETTADGKVITKAQVLAELSPDKKYDTYTIDDLKSTMSGDTGTATGRASVVREGKTEKWQFTTAFRKEQGQWRAVSTQITNYQKQ